MLTNTFKTNVKNKDIVAIRSNLGSLLSRVSGTNRASDLDEAIRYCEQEGVYDDIFVQHDGEELSYSGWSDEYFHSQVGRLGINFSRTRFELLVKIAKALYAKARQSNTSNATGAQNNQKQKREFSSSKKILLIVAGALVLVTAAIVM